jgi:hypothetical protein
LRKLHAGSAFRAAEQLECEQRDCGQVIGHCIVSHKTGRRWNQPAPLIRESPVNIDQFPENKSKATNASFRGRRRDHAFAIAKLPFAILLHMVKMAQTLLAWRRIMDLAVGRRNEEETDLRVRICDSTEAASVPTGRAKSPPVSRLAYEGVPQSPAGLPLANQIPSENLA